MNLIGIHCVRCSGSAHFWCFQFASFPSVSGNGVGKWRRIYAPAPSGNKSHTECDIEILRIGKIAKSKTIYFIHLRQIICQ